MNILVIYPYIPFPLDRGTFQRTFHLLLGLAERHTVDLLALSENGERLEHQSVFESFCREVRFVPFSHPKWKKLFPQRFFQPKPSTIEHWNCEEVANAIREQLRRYDYDAVHVCDIVLAQYFLKEHKDIPLTVDRSRVDLQYQTQQTRFGIRSWKGKLLALENIAKLWFYEKRVARRSQRQVLCGPDDHRFVRRFISRSVPLQVVPNGVDLDYFRHDPHNNTDLSPTIVFCGAMDYMPNIDAIRWYFSEIHQHIAKAIPELKVLIVGREAGPEIREYSKVEGVTVTGGVPDVRPYYRRSWIQIVPLRIGGGTRLKIIESLSMGLPVVSTSIGAQGLNLKDGTDILLADDAGAFAAKVVDALSSEILRKNLQSNGIRQAHEHFAWKLIGKDLANSYPAMSTPNRDRVRMLDIPFDRVSLEGTLARISEMVESRQPSQIATANVDFLVQSRRDPELREILENAPLVLCDGTPLVWLSRLLGKALPERVAGSDMTPHLLALAERKGWRVFFLGGKEQVLEQAVENVGNHYPRLEIAGSYSPAFAPLEDMDQDEILRRIEFASPDILLTFFGCPKQEKWLSRHLATSGVPVGIGLGATVDFLAGNRKRAPRWMRRSGLEWVFRLLQEPRRLFQRYATDLSVFVAAAWTELRRNSNPARPS